MASSLDGVSYGCLCVDYTFTPASVRAGDAFSVVR